MLIYLIRNITDGMQYVGKTTKTAAYRWKRHVYRATKLEVATYLHNTIRKHGAENFRVEILSRATNPEILNVLEKFWIRELNTKAPNGYNLTDGGEGISGFKISEETKKKHRAVVRPSPSHRKGAKHSEETRKKMSESALKRDPRTRSTGNLELLTTINIGRRQSLEHRQKISMAHKKRFAERKENKCLFAS